MCWLRGLLDHDTLLGDGLGGLASAFLCQMIYERVDKTLQGKTGLLQTVDDFFWIS